MEFWEGDFEANGKRRFMEYYKEVRSLVPEGSLLEYQMGDGWKPLCDFLELPTPDGKPFPHINDANGFVNRCRRRNRKQMLNVLFRVMVLGCSMTAIFLGGIMTRRCLSYTK